METSYTDSEDTSVAERVCEIADKLEKLSELVDGWNGPLTKAIKIEAINWGWQLVSVIASAPNNISIIPAGDGTLLLTWKNGETEYTAEILPGDNHDRMYLFIDHINNDEFEEYDGEIDEIMLTRFIETNSWKLP